MTDQHPITPPPELVQQWAVYMPGHESPEQLWLSVATQAARWGADQELEACCKYLTHCAAWEPEDVKEFCDLRRPKPPSLKQLALKSLDAMDDCMSASFVPMRRDLDTIRCALEALPDD